MPDVFLSTPMQTHGLEAPEHERRPQPRWQRLHRCDHWRGRIHTRSEYVLALGKHRQLVFARTHVLITGWTVSYSGRRVKFTYDARRARSYWQHLKSLF
jgi:hypothetical protein